MIYTVIPGVGVNSIKLNSHRNDVISKIGIPELRNGKVDIYNEAIFQIHYDQNENVEFIEIYAGDSQFMSANIYDINIFSTIKLDILERIKQKTGLTPKKSGEYPHTCTYDDLSLSFWSDSDPSDYSEKDKINNPSDFYESQYFKSVGVGVSGYFNF